MGGRRPCGLERRASTSCRCFSRSGYTTLFYSRDFSLATTVSPASANSVPLVLAVLLLGVHFGRDCAKVSTLITRGSGPLSISKLSAPFAASFWSHPRFRIGTQFDCHF